MLLFVQSEAGRKAPGQCALSLRPDGTTGRYERRCGRAVHTKHREPVAPGRYPKILPVFPPLHKRKGHFCLPMTMSESDIDIAAVVMNNRSMA